MAERPPVPRGIRVVNAISILLFLAGAGAYAWAWRGMRELTTYETAPDAAAFAGMERFNHYHDLSRTAIWLVMAAVAVAVLAAIGTWVLRRKDADPEEA